MARRVFTQIVFALGLLCFTTKVVDAQQVTFAISPSNLTPTPAVGDTVSLQISVTNFTNIVSFQYAIEWDPLLFTYISLDNVNIVDPSNFGSNAFGGNTVLIGWNSTGGAGRTLPNGQNIFRLRLKVKAASTNYWAKFSSTNTSIEVVQYPSTVIIPAFSNLGNPPGTTTTPVTVQATNSQTVPTQSKVCVDVTTNDFTNISTVQWVTKWNPAVLRYDSISVMNNTIGFTVANFNTTQASGRIALNWAAASGTSKSVANGALLYRVCYTSIGSNGTSSTVSFDSAQIFQAVGGSSNRVSMNGVSGTVNVGTGQPSTGLIFTASNHVVNQNDQVCVQVKTASFINIATMTYAIFFDSTKMTFLNAKLVHPNLGTDSLGMAGGASNGFNNSPSGTLRFLWVTPTGNGVTLPDSAVVMQICFKYTAGAGTSSLIRFGAYGQKQSIKDGDLNTVPAIYRQGSISVVGGITALTSSSNIKNVSCPSGSDGGVTLTVSGGNGSYTYLWSNGATTKDIANVTAATYKVTITSGAATKVDSFTVTQPAAFNVTNTITPVSCFGQSNGAISLTVAGGTSPYSYKWSNTATTQNITALAEGSYTVTITDSKSCIFTPAAIVVTQPAVLSIATATKTNVSCKSGSDGAINITVAGGTTNYTYSWLGNNGFSNNTQNITGLKADIYNLTVTDSKGCTVSRKDTLLEPDSLLIGAATVKNTKCGSQTGAITIAGVTGGNGGNTFSWTGSNFTATTQNISNLAAGQYTLTVKDSKMCSATKSVTVADSSSNVVISNPTIAAIKCNGGSDGSITASATGGTGTLTYNWTGPAGFNFTAQTIDGLRAGTYNLSVSDAGGCFKSASYVISEPTAITMTPSVTNIKCKGDLTGAIALNAVGGTGTLTFVWTGTTATTQNIANLKAGAYSVTLTDANLCTKNQSFTITEPTDSLKVLSASVAKISCFGGSNGAVSITVGGGAQPYQFAWAGPSGFNSTAQNISTLIAGTYRLTLSDANQCSYIKSYNVDANPALVVTASVSVAMRSPNGAITLTVSGGTPQYTYLWSGQAVNPTSKDQTGLCPGNYSVTVTDNVGCTFTKSYVIGGECSTPMTFTNPTITPAGCPGQNLGKIDVGVSGGASPYKYYWLNAARDTIGRERIISGLTAGIYTIIVEDFIGQRINNNYPVPGSQSAVKINSATVAAETCTGADGSINLGISGGADPYKYYWSDLSGDNQQRDRNNIRAGVYSVQVKDANGCLKDSNNIIVPKQPCPLVTITTKKDAKCFGESNGSIFINIQNGEPGYVIRWSANDSVRINNQPSRSGNYEITGLRAGTYIVTITDSRGQSKLETQTVGQSTQITISRTVTPVTNGCNGAIVLSVSGGQGSYAYSWNTGATSRDLFGLCCDSTKRYSVTVTDGSQCIASTGNDNVPCAIAALSVDATVRNPTCKLDSLSGRIELTTIGGSSPFTYQWTNDRGNTVGNNSPILSNVPPGKYFVTVTDSRQPNPQRYQGSFTLSITSTLKLANLVVTPASDDITPNGKASIDIQGGAADFSVVWCNGSSSVATNTARTPSVSNLYSGNCSVIVTDRQGCSEKVDFLVGSNSCATIEILSQIKCYGEQNGSARIIKTSLDLVLPIQSYRWATSESEPIAFKLKGGENQVTITDANGRVCISRAIITEPTKLVASITTDLKAKTAQAVISGGVTPYSLKWIPSIDTARKITFNKAGTIYLFVSDRNGCNTTAEVDVYPDIECLIGSSIISPNDDSRNESFTINGCDFKSIRLEVYNRWGQLVYSKNNYASGQWQGNDQDGTAGKQLSDGVYLYIMRANDSNGQPVIGKGTVTIVRQ